MMVAAANDRPAIVEQLVVARADLNTKNSNGGCALPLGRRCRRRPCWLPTAPCACAVRQEHSAALCGVERLHQIRRGAARQRRQPDHHEQGRVTLCRSERRGQAAHRIGPNRHRRTPRQEAEYYNKLAAYDAAVAEVRPPASSMRSSFGLQANAMPRHARSTAQTAFFGLRQHTRGMMCASHCARSAGVIGRQRVGREHSALRLTVRGAAPQTAHTGT